MASDSDYLYDQKGPWPQPNPLSDALFPAILHLPFRERVQWNLRVGLRYARQILFFTPQALVYALRKPKVQILSDYDFEERFDNTVFNKMIVSFSPPDKGRRKRQKAARSPSLQADSEQEPDPATGMQIPEDMEDQGDHEHPPLPDLQGPIAAAQSRMMERCESLALAMAMEAFPEFMEHELDEEESSTDTGEEEEEEVSSAMPSPQTAEAQLSDPAGPSEKAKKKAGKAKKSGIRYFIADFSIFEELPTFPGTYAAGTQALFKRRAVGDRLEVLAIKVNGVKFTPKDGDAWELAKLFTMQAGTIRLVFATHALLHFPVDSVNAISKNQLPTDHVLYQLLIPHTDLQLVLDSVVQTSNTSPLINKQLFPWCSHTGPSSGLVKTLEQLYLGVKDNPAYPAYHYKYPRRTEEEKYVSFLRAYYDTILCFVCKVLKKVKKHDPIVMRWADYVSKSVPGFPDGENIFKDHSDGVRNLDWAVATFIWDVSVGHTTDHYNMGLLDINENPMRIRVPPPTSKDATFDRSKLRNWADIFRYRLFWRLFLTSATVYRLDKVRYPFTDPELRRFNDDFLEALQKTATTESEHEFIPLREIATSVQF